jgi:hypothetical protein
MTMTEIGRHASEAVLRKLIAKGYGVDAAGRRAIEARVEAAVELATAKRHVEDVRKREAPKVESMAERIERSDRVQKSFHDAIVDYQRAHGCSREHAIDRVLLSPTVSEYHRLDAAVAKLGARQRFPEKSPEEMRTDLNPPGDENVIADVNDLIQRIAAQQMRAHPALNKAQAVEQAIHHPDVAAAHVAEKRRKGLAM